MKCEKFELLIALQAEGDLPPQETTKVEAHLSACPACREFAAELQVSQAAVCLLSQTEFSEAIRADLRRSVMNQISVRPAGPNFWSRLFRPLNWQFAALAAALALLFVSAVFYLSRPDPQPVSNIQHPNEPVPDVQPVTAHDTGTQQARFDKLRHHRSAARARFVKAPEFEARNQMAAVAKLPETETVPEPGPMNPAAEAAPAPANDEQRIRMEIQTRDPNIRIIWLVNKEPRRTASE
ncbi:MAG TPA: zf-HC2 domain-containing protein [Blastocatellia bacterium]|nr:zf-HC2 domain-containing protein [Blastocatellia bacterium]